MLGRAIRDCQQQAEESKVSFISLIVLPVVTRSLVLRVFAALGFVGELFAVHALTVGAIGGMTIGMMTRTARGHSGRPLVADPFEVACYVLVVAPR